jgi:hypothetical protein
MPYRTRHVVCAASFVVGDAAIELPVAAVEATVREQIAKVTALMSSGLPESWGTPLIGGMPDGRTRAQPDDWHEVVYHHERAAPLPDIDPSALMDALVDAFNVHVTQQTGFGAAFWLGAIDTAGLTCEVPFGPGPFPGGAVWAANPHRAVDDADSTTSLVQAHIATNPHLGDGLLLRMHLGVDPPSQHRTIEWTAALLNEQASLTAPGATVGTAHGIGAWVELDGRLEYRCFVPAAWLAEHDGPDPRHLLHELLANLARISGSARHVVEFDPFDALARLKGGHDMPRSGLAAGVGARGPAFGELGVGTDPGAELLAHAFELTVGSTTEWAQRTPDGRGFDWSPNRFRQRFRTEPCPCDHEPGAVVTIATPLGTPRHDPLVHLLDELRGLGAAHPFAVGREPDGGIELRSQLHVHAASVGRLRSWPTALAVAQALVAERLTHLEPTGSRDDRDAILGIVDLPQFRTAPDGPDLPADVGSTDDSLLGPSLTIETRVDTQVDGATASWILDANARLLAQHAGTITGGFIVDDGIVLRSCLPVGLGSNHAGEPLRSLSAMLVEAHTSMVVEAMGLVEESRRHSPARWSRRRWRPGLAEISHDSPH